MVNLINKPRSWINSLSHEVFITTSQRFLDKKMKVFAYNTIFSNIDMAEHFAHIRLEEIASQNVVQGYIIDRIQFIKQVLVQKQIDNDTFIDIGDPSGIFIISLGKEGLSANVSEVAVKNTRMKEIAAIRCDAEHLPFKNNSIDHILFFQIFEHLPNPIAGLKELHRVAVKSVFLSIPYVSKTNIHKYNYNPEWPIYEHHIFEFDSKDFKKIISHAHFTIGSHVIFEVLKPHTLKEHIVFFLSDFMSSFWHDPEYPYNSKDLFSGCFKKFSVYHLIKK